MPKNSSSAASYGNSTKDHRKRVPSKVYLQFRVCGDRHRDFPDVSRSQSIVLIHCMNRIFLAACLGEEIIGSLLRYETCICAYYFFESKRFDPKRNPVFIEPVTSIINLKRMNDVCRYAPSLGSTNQIWAGKNVHTFFEVVMKIQKNKGNEVPSTTQLILRRSKFPRCKPRDIVVQVFPDSITRVTRKKKNISGEMLKS